MACLGSGPPSWPQSENRERPVVKDLPCECNGLGQINVLSIMGPSQLNTVPSMSMSIHLQLVAVRILRLSNFTKHMFGFHRCIFRPQSPSGTPDDWEGSINLSYRRYGIRSLSLALFIYSSFILQERIFWWLL